MDNQEPIRRGRRNTGRDKPATITLNEKQKAKLKFYAKSRNQSMSAFIADLLDKVPNLLQILDIVEGENEPAEPDRLAA